MRGIDVSHHQGTIDWETVKSQAGLGFVIMKAMFENGHGKESAFEANYAGAAGLKRGAYLYSIAMTPQEAQLEAEDFVRILAKRKLEYGVWLDLEDKRQRVLSKAELTRIIDVEAGIILAAGYPCGIYSNKDWYNNVIDGRRLQERYDFWIARYPRDDYGAVKEPLAPHGWAKLWQYSSKGKVPGIKGNVDLDIEMDDLADTRPAGNPYAPPEKNLKEGSRGNDVRWLQYELNLRGAKLVIDGHFGLKTDAAVRAYQNQHALICDGIVGPQTRSELIAGN